MGRCRSCLMSGCPAGVARRCVQHAAVLRVGLLLYYQDLRAEVSAIYRWLVARVARNGG